MQVKKQQLELDINSRLVQIEKAVGQGYIWSPSLFNLYAEYIMWNAGLDEVQAGIKIAGRNIKNLSGRKWRGTKKALDESKRRE